MFIKRGYIFGIIIILSLFGFNKVSANGQILDVPFLKQFPPGTSWDDTHNCGETSYVMVDAFYTKRNIDQNTIKEVDDWLYENLGKPIRNYNGSSMLPKEFKDLSIGWGDFLNDNVVIRYDLSVDDITNLILSDKLVVVLVYTNMNKRGAGLDVAHYMVITGIGDDIVYMNDPGKTLGKNKEYSMDLFLKSWALNKNVAIVFSNPTKLEEPPEEIITPPIQKSLWEKFKDLFTDNDEVKTEEETQLVGDENNKEENVNKDEEKQEEEIKELAGTYNLSFTNSGQSLSVQPGEVVNLKAEVKNTGIVDWNKNNISANVVGGQAVNTKYYYNSWLTKLRPALLDNSVSVGQVGTFSFSITAPVEIGKYDFKIQAVRVDDNFKYIDGGFWTVNLQVEEKIVEEEIPEEKENVVETDPSLSDGDKKNIIEKIVDEIKEVVEDVKDVVKKVIHYGGGGSNTIQDTDDKTQDNEPETTAENPEVNITSHSSSTEYTVSSTTLIFGTKNQVTKKVYVNTSTADIVSSTAWEMRVDLSLGDNIFNIYGENSVGDKTATNTIKIVFDNAGPEITFFEAGQSDFLTPTMFINWQADSAVYYDLQVNKNETGWEDLVLQTTSTDFSLFVDQLSSYCFRLKAYDNLGNVSDWKMSNSVVVDWPKTVVINEIAWAGTGPSAKQKADEWIELYNNTDETIDLIDWQIFLGDTVLTFKTIVNPIILPDGYLLLERTDDDSVMNVSVDILFTGELNNSGQKIILKDVEGNIIDEVDCTSGWYNAPIVNNQYRSLARIDSQMPGSLASNWQNYPAIAPKAKPYGGGSLYGSPKYKNTGNWLLNNLAINYADLFANNILRLSTDNSPYVIDSSTEIPTDYIVQIDPGVVLYGLNNTAYFKVSGELELNGTEENPVVITSALDNNYINNNQSTLTGDPVPGDWSRIEVQPRGNLQVTYAKFLYGGNRFFQAGGFVFGGKYMSQIIRNVGGSVALNNVEIKNAYLESNSDFLDYNTMVWNEAVVGYSATTTINNSLLDNGWLALKNYRQNNGESIYSRLENSTIQNFQSPDGSIKSERDFVYLNNNTFVNNLNDEVYMGSWTLFQNETLQAGINYIFSSINIPNGFVLTVNPGVNIKMISDINVDGSLQILGTADAPVNINPYNTNWGRINFNNSNSVLHYVDLTGGNSSGADNNGVIKSVNSILDLSDVNFINTRRPYNVLYLENSTTILTNSNIGWLEPKNTGLTIRGIKLNGGSLQLDSINFSEMDIGIDVTADGLVEMQNMTENNFQNIHSHNWWPESVWGFATST